MPVRYVRQLLIYCDVHAVGQQSQQRKCLFTTVAGQRTRHNSGSVCLQLSLGNGHARNNESSEKSRLVVTQLL
jgi:hypothetical protein